MGDVIWCRPVEVIFVDPSRLIELGRRRGTRRTELIVSAAAEEIAERLTGAEAAWSAGEFTRLGKIARSLVGLSDEMGMETLATIAAGIAGADARDEPALAALVARLVRVGEQSLCAIWDLGHLRL